MKNTDVDVDYCVFGSGPAGLTVAEYLVEHGASVAVIEQGPRFEVADRGALLVKRRERLEGRELDFDHDTPPAFRNAEPTSLGPVPYSYGFLSGVGGASVHWDGHTPRLTAEDMSVRSLYGYGRDWPISYKEFEPWLLRAEHKMGVSADEDNPYASERTGPFAMPAHPASYFEARILSPAMGKAGWKAHSRPNAIASRPYQERAACMGCRACTVCPSGARYSADRVSLPSFLRHEGARLLSGVKLRRLDMTRDGRAVAAGLAVDQEGREQVLRARRYVLALGGIETPRMLWLSAGQGHPNGLGNAGGQLGVGFSDHPMTYFWYFLDKKAGHSLGFPSMNCEYFRSTGGRKDITSFSLNMLPAPVNWDFIPTTALISEAMRDGVLSLERVRDLMQRSVVGYGMHEHTGKGQMTLDRAKKDAFGDPVPAVSIDVTARDRAGLDARARASQRLADILGADLHEYRSDEIHWASHPCGGTAMGTSPENGVCDSDLRVWGLDNLHIVSSSVFPHTGANNPTLTIVALALRLARHLAGR